MASRPFNTKSPTIKRILREASELSSSPSPDYTATPLEDNLFEWHFTLRGPPGDTHTSAPDPERSPGWSSGQYAEGIYHGRIVLPPTYPLRPPSFRFLTPSGRFETNREICLSISGHHEETWQPAWGLRTALVALRSFMETDAKGQLGGLECSDSMRRRMAKESRSWTCSGCGKSNEAILQECAQAAAALGNGKANVEVEIPSELKMGWKDEMGKNAARERDPEKPAIESEDSGEEDDEESAELAEGFVPTAPSPASLMDPILPTTAPAAAPIIPPRNYPAARPAQTVPQPTRTAPTTTTAIPPYPRQAQLQRRNTNTNDGVPAWIDKAIGGLFICLMVMVLKFILGL